MPQTPEERKAYKKKWYEENKDKIEENRKKNKDKVAQGNKKWYEENKEIISQGKKKYYEENKEIISQGKKKYYEENREEIAKRSKKYSQTKSGKHKGWKKSGIKILEDTYEKFEECKNCELCNVELTTKGKTRKVLDHDHDSGYARFVCCNNCNIKLGAKDRMMDRVHKELWRYHNRR